MKKNIPCDRDIVCVKSFHLSLFFRFSFDLSYKQTGQMFQIESATVTHIRLVEKGNIIICRRKQDLGLTTKIKASIASKQDEKELHLNRIYALKIIGKEWMRAVVKFVKKDGGKVLQLIDESGVFDYDEKRMKLREITDKNILNIPFAEMKCIVYGIGPYVFDDEFILIFNELLKEKEIVAIFGLIEQKSSKVHEAFACDFLYLYNGRYNSFREVLIQQHISYPSRVKEAINRNIFMKKTEFLQLHNVCPKSLTLHASASSSADIPQFVLNNRFNIHNLIGEGGVIYYTAFRDLKNFRRKNLVEYGVS